MKITNLQATVNNLRDSRRFLVQELLSSNNESPTEGPKCNVCLSQFDSERHKATRLEIIIDNFHKNVPSLKCGHVFGNVCITRWMVEKSSCPTCNQASSMQDLQVLYF